MSWNLHQHLGLNIYIDPPYNTGGDFVYPDNYKDSIKNYLDLTGQTSSGTKVSSNLVLSPKCWCKFQLIVSLVV